MSSWLLVEDEPDLYEVLVHLSDIFATEVIAYTTAEDALSWLETLPLTLDGNRNRVPIFGLIDIRLPGQINGIQLARHLHNHPLLKNMPVILMTAYRLSWREEKEAIRYSGARRLIYKPLPSFAEMRQIFKELT
ncbi:MAG: response regulator [Anaerolineaceae bacterium]|nr:response regulator [Anaerolineaceae bacterium]